MPSLALLACIAGALLSGSGAANTVACPTGWFLYIDTTAAEGNNSCLAVSTGTMTWSAAGTYCAGLSAGNAPHRLTTQATNDIYGSGAPAGVFARLYDFAITQPWSGFTNGQTIADPGGGTSPLWSWGRAADDDSNIGCAAFDGSANSGCGIWSGSEPSDATNAVGRNVVAYTVDPSVYVSEGVFGAGTVTSPTPMHAICEFEVGLRAGFVLTPTTNNQGEWVPCSAGKYNDGTGNACTDCAADTFQNLTGQAACLACPTGTSQSGTGQAFCTCDAGVAPTACAVATDTLFNGRCYKACLANYTASGASCVQTCPTGYTDGGGKCTLVDVVDKVMYDRGFGVAAACNAGEVMVKTTCFPVCRGGYHSNPTKPAICVKNGGGGSYFRGRGRAFKCGTGESLLNLRCLPNCAVGYTASGTICVKGCPTGYVSTGTECSKTTVITKGSYIRSPRATTTLACTTGLTLHDGLCC